MKREQRATLSLLGLLFILGAVLWGYEFWVNKETPETTISWPLNGALIEQAHLWEVKHKGASFTLRLSNGKWEVIAPFKTEAHSEKVANFLGQLAQVQPKKELQSKMQQKSWGLQSAAHVLKAFDENKEPLFEFSLGQVNDFDQTIYVSLTKGGAPAQFFALPRLMGFRLGISLENMRDNRLCPGADADLTQIKYRWKSPTKEAFIFENKKSFGAQKDRGSPYQLLFPVEGPADERRMTQLSSFLANREILEMLTENHQENLEEWNLLDPEYSLWINSPQWSQPRGVFFARDKNNPKDLFVTRSDVTWVGRLSIKALKYLNFDFNDVVDKRFFSFNLGEVYRWEFWENNLGHWILEQKQGEFVMLAPQPALLQVDRVKKALMAFSYLEGKSVLSQDQISFEEHQKLAEKKWELKMSFFTRKGKMLGELIFYAHEEKTLGISAEREKVFVVHPGIKKLLPGNIEAWLLK